MGKEKRTAIADEIVVAGTILKRLDFGEGMLGTAAWNLIKSGAQCGAIVQGGKCGLPAIGTTDFDVLGDAELIPHCSDACHRAIIGVVEKDLARTGRTTCFGRNGLGRA